MRYKNLIFILKFCLILYSSNSYAEYQSNYDFNEEYNCYLSAGNQNFISRNEEGIIAPLKQRDDGLSEEYSTISDFFNDAKELFSLARINIRPSINGDLIVTLDSDEALGGTIPIFFMDILKNNNNQIIANRIDFGSQEDEETKDNIVSNTLIIFKNDNSLNSSLIFDISNFKKQLIISFDGRCEKVNS